jgi:hypothetical protein
MSTPTTPTTTPAATPAPTTAPTQAATGTATQQATPTTTTPPPTTTGETPTTTPTPQPPAQAGTQQAPTETPARVIPESYALSLSQGSVLDQADVADVVALAKQQQFTQEEAQAALAAYEQQLLEQGTKFRTELEADAELGGAHLATTQRDVKRALDTLVPETTAEGKAVRAFLHKSGLGNQVHLLRVLARAGKAMGEDRPVAAPASTTKPIDFVDLFYGSGNAA